MKTPIHAVFAFAFTCVPLFAANPPAVTSGPDVSFRNEIQHAIDKGLTWLHQNQNTNGYWSTADQPALTSLALTAFMGDPAGDYQAHPTAEIERGFAFVTNNAHPDGSIYAKGLQNYNTSICMMGLVAAHQPKYDPILRRGREFILTQQVKTNSPGNGGVGYGDHGMRSDMNNTMHALEALYYTKYLAADARAAGKDLNWDAAIHFIQACQNLPSVNKQAWVSTNANDTGGFVYVPEQTKSSPVTTENGRVALRSYGSISYAGLLSYIYADLPHDDPRIQAAFDWVQNNYTLDENPALGQQGLYYYLHLMTKALSIYGVDQLHLAGGKSVDWRHDVAMKLINLQKADGSWANDNGRWWEHDPALVTSYSLMALEMIYRSM